MNGQQKFEAIRQWVRDWVEQNRAAFAELGGAFEEREGADWDGTPFYTVDCIAPHCMARIVVSTPAFHPFRFVHMEVLDADTERELFSWHDAHHAATRDAVQTALQSVQALLLAANKAA